MNSALALRRAALHRASGAYGCTHANLACHPGPITAPYHPERTAWSANLTSVREAAWPAQQEWRRGRSLRVACQRGSSKAAEVSKGEAQGTSSEPASSQGSAHSQATGPQSAADTAQTGNEVAADRNPPNPTPPNDNSSAAEVDRQLSAVWEDLKREMRKEVDPEAAKLLDTISYDELTSSNAMHFFRKLAGAQLGPMLEALGVTEDPFDFFVEVIKLATFLQFITCGLVWYGSQGLAHLPPGQALTATAGMALGYLTRPAFKVEQLLFPAYNGLLQLMLPNATYVVSPSTREQVQGTINKLGITLAVVFLVPQALFGWDTSDSTALVVPLTMGWFLFDLTYMVSLLLQLRQREE